MTRRRWFLTVILAPFLALQSISLAYYIREQRSLTAYVDSVASPSLPPSEQVKAVVMSLRDKQGDTTDAFFMCPLFGFLRPTPLQVIERGGDCADRARLTITLLRLRGIHSSKWALYNSEGESKHAVVEADVESGKMVVDGLFGIWFPKPQGGYYAIRELKADPTILPRRIKELRAQNLQPGVAPLKFYPLDDYVYFHARTINWKKSAPMRLSYWVLHHILGQAVDDLARPAFVEEPPLMVIYGATGFEFVLIVGWLLVQRLRKRTAYPRTKNGTEG